MEAGGSLEGRRHLQSILSRQSAAGDDKSPTEHRDGGKLRLGGEMTRKQHPYREKPTVSMG